MWFRSQTIMFVTVSDSLSLSLNGWTVLEGKTLICDRSPQQLRERENQLAEASKQWCYMQLVSCSSAVGTVA